MRAILVDDEKPALLQLERLLSSVGGITVEGSYTRLQAAFDHIAGQKVDVVFLDIGMPGMNGLQAGERLLQLDADIQIVYVTAYADYAIDAFELNALDYLLKPVEIERLRKTVQRLEKHFLLSRPREEPRENGSPRVRLFKRLELLEPTGVSSMSVRWRTQKAQELFAFLLHHHNKWVLKEQILETLWGGLEDDKAMAQLHTTVYQIRKTVKEWGAEAKLDYSQGCYRLSIGQLVTDVELFLRESEDGSVTTEQEWERRNRALRLYEGDYLEEHGYLWAQPRCAELRNVFLNLSMMMIEYEQKTGKHRQALERLLVLQQKDPFSDEICRMVLIAYAKVGEAAAAARHYEAFAALLRSELKVLPDAQTEQLYKRLFGTEPSVTETL